MATQVTVPGSASTSGSADFRNSATSFSLPGLASRGTYSATFDIVSSCKYFLTRAIMPLCKRRNSVRLPLSRRIDIWQRRDDGSGGGPVFPYPHRSHPPSGRAQPASLSSLNGGLCFANPPDAL